MLDKGLAPHIFDYATGENILAGLYYSKLITVILGGPQLKMQ